MPSELPATPASERRRSTLVRLGLLALLALLILPKIRGPIDLRFDAGVYYLLGTSLAQGRGYRLANEPGEIEAVQYPPVLPALVAVHQLVLGSADPFVVAPALRLSMHALYVAYVLAAYAFARRYASTGTAFLVAAFSAANLYAYYLSDLCFSEMPFAAVTMGFLLVPADRTWLRGTLATLAFGLRTIGLALLGAWVLEALIERRWRAACLRLTIAAVPVLAWQAYVHRVQSSEDYRAPAYAYQRAPWNYYNVTYADNLRLVDPFQPELGRLGASGALQRVGANLQRLPLSLGEAASSPDTGWEWMVQRIYGRLGLDGEPGPWVLIAPFAVGLFVAVGLVAMSLGAPRTAALYAIASIALICSTPWPSQVTRYLMPVTPVLVLAGFSGLDVIRRRARPPIRTGLTTGLLVVPIAMVQTFVAYSTYTWQRGHVSQEDLGGQAHEASYFYFTRGWQGMERAFLWVREHVEADAIVACSTPHQAYLRTGRRAVMVPFEADAEACLELLDSVPVQYVIVDSLAFIDVARRYVAPALALEPERWVLVHEDVPGDVKVYRCSRPD